MNPTSTTGRAAGGPLCLNQEQLLLSREWMRQQSGSPPSSVIPTVLTLRGCLNRDALQRSLDEVVRRHAALRARFFPAPELSIPERQARLLAFGHGIYKPGFYRQSISESVRVEIRGVDLAGLSAPATADGIQETLHEDVGGQFDYEKPPLVRATLVKRGPQEHLLIILVDHAVADAWSMRLLRTELALLYKYFCGGTEYPLSEPGLQYPDYGLWQNQAMATTYFDEATEYWRKQWAHFGSARIAPRELPFAAPAPRHGRPSFGAVRGTLEAHTCQEIRKFARQSRVTLNTFFLAAYAVVLHSYTRKPQLALWGHFSNRRRADVQKTIGYFMHSHLIGLDFSAAPSGVELLHQVRTKVLEGYDHQEMPLAYLWHRLNRWPRYADTRVLLDYHRADETWEQAEPSHGLVIRRSQLPESLSGRFSSLGVYIKDDSDGMSFSVQYAKDRFPPEAVGHLVEDLQLVIARLLAQPDRKVSDYFDKPRYSDFPVRLASEMSEFLSVDE